MQDSQAVFINIHKLFLGPDHVTRQVAETKKNCKPPSMAMRGKGGIGISISHSTKNSMPSWRALQIKAIVTWTMAP